MILVTNVVMKFLASPIHMNFSILLFLPQGNNLNYIITLQHCCFCLQVFSLIEFQVSLMVLYDFHSCEAEEYYITEIISFSVTSVEL